MTCAIGFRNPLPLSLKHPVKSVVIGGRDITDQLEWTDQHVTVQGSFDGTALTIG